MAICPAGPPKLIKPSLSQKRKASLKLTGSGGCIVFFNNKWVVVLSGYQLKAAQCKVTDAGRGLQPRPKRLAASITFETLNVKDGVTNPVLPRLLFSDAGRGLQPRPKRLAASITFEILNVKDGVTNPVLPSLMRMGFRCRSGFTTPTETFGCFNNFRNLKR